MNIYIYIYTVGGWADGQGTTCGWGSWYRGDGKQRFHTSHFTLVIHVTHVYESCRTCMSHVSHTDSWRWEIKEGRGHVTYTYLWVMSHMYGSCLTHWFVETGNKRGQWSCHGSWEWSCHGLWDMSDEWWVMIIASVVRQRKTRLHIYI